MNCRGGDGEEVRLVDEMKAIIFLTANNTMRYGLEMITLT